LAGLAVWSATEMKKAANCGGLFQNNYHFSPMVMTVVMASTPSIVMTSATVMAPATMMAPAVYLDG
jgi:hypothetical protein